MAGDRSGDARSRLRASLTGRDLTGSDRYIERAASPKRGRRRTYSQGSDRSFDPRLEVALRQRADLHGGHLPVLEQHQRRDAADAVGGRMLRVVVDVHLGHGDLIAAPAGDLLQCRSDNLARTAKKEKSE